MKKILPFIFNSRKWRLATALCTLMLLTAASKAQPVLVKDIPASSHSFVTANGLLYFANGDSLFTATAGSVNFIKKLNETIVSISDVTVGNKVFIITTAGTQKGLWVSNVSAASTVKVATHPTIIPVIANGSDLYLSIDDGTHGLEAWKLSSSNSLSMLKDINPGSASGMYYYPFFSFTVSNNQTFFFATDPAGKDLWKTDGTSAGTIKAVDLPSNEVFQIKDVNGTMFFDRDSTNEELGDQYTELWKTQGTAASTQLVKSFGWHYPYHGLTNFTEHNGKLFFVRHYGNPDQDLIASDGSEAGTYTVAENINYDGHIERMVSIQNYVAFYGQTQGFPTGISKADGTPGQVSEVRQLNYVYSSGSSMDYVDLTVAEDRLFFIDHGGSAADWPTPDAEFVLYESNSPYNPSSTKSLQEIHNFPYNHTKNLTLETGNNVFFTTQNSDNVIKLWFYDPDATCAGTGGLTREVWTNVSGNNVTSIPFSRPPDRVENVTSFAGPVNEADRYGARYRGYLCVPTSGNYKFFIASDDYSELFLSTTSSPANKKRIAYVHGATKRGEYTKYPSQQSVLVPLVAGTRYYIEATHKEGTTYDHLMVAMQYPGGTMENPINGSHLIPFIGNKPPTITITSPEDGHEFGSNEDITVKTDVADEDGSIVKVEFFVDGGFYNDQKFASDDTAPYEGTWSTCCPQGTFTLTAKVYDNAGGTSSASVTISRFNCSATGQLLREVWTNVKGLQVSTIPTGRAPNSSGYLTSFEGPVNTGDYYGARIRGYLCVPSDGEYTFYISSDDHSELWLSDGSDPANKTKIAFVFGATKRREWTKYASQKSVKIFMHRNKKYYVEVLHKENLGNDHIAVGWVLPNGTSEMPIPGTRISPFEGNSSAREATMVSADEPMDEPLTDQSSISLTPNPVKSGKVTLRTPGFAIQQDSKMLVQVISLTGEIVLATEFLCDSNCEEVELDFSGKVRPGIYLVKGSAEGKLFTRRMVVE